MKKRQVQSDKTQEQVSGTGRTAGEFVERFGITEQIVPLPHHFLCEAKEQGLYCNFSLILPLILNSYFW